MSSNITTSSQRASVATTRSARVAARLEANAHALASFARALTDPHWRAVVPHDGRTVDGQRSARVTWPAVHGMNAAHANIHANVTREEAFSPLTGNAAAAATAVRALEDGALDPAGDFTLRRCGAHLPVHARGSRCATRLAPLGRPAGDACAADIGTRQSAHKTGEKTRRIMMLTALVLSVWAAPRSMHAQAPQEGGGHVHAERDRPSADGSLVAKVRRATATYRNIDQALLDGYQQFGGCVSGPESGAMGVHFVKGSLVDATLDVEHPEALIYEVKGSVARLVGVEYITPVPVWDAAHTEVPVLGGQHLQLVGTPNRYRLPALYELHVWAWRDNPRGRYVDWNTNVVCE